MIPGSLVAARNGSPLLVGVGEDECSWPPMPRRCCSTPARWSTWTMTRWPSDPRGFRSATWTPPGSAKVSQFDWDRPRWNGAASPFHAQGDLRAAQSLWNTLAWPLLEDEGTARVSGLNLTDEELKRFERVIITACGTSWHSGIIGEYMFEEIARLPVEVEYASEFRYRNPVVDKSTLVIGISQSGETADTLAASARPSAAARRTIGLVNVVGCTIAREVDGGIYLHAGPEIGVAHTKAFTSQVTVLALITLRIARLRNLEHPPGPGVHPGAAAAARRRSSRSWSAPTRSSSWPTALRTRRTRCTSAAAYNFPVALEGALKLKEISYIHAEGYPAAEMKHGPIALIDEHMPVVFIAPRDAVHSKIVSNIEEVKARGGRSSRSSTRATARSSGWPMPPSPSPRRWTC